MAEVIERRRQICRGCPHWAGQCKLGHSIGSLRACPIGKFPGRVGDLVAAVAQPVAGVIDLLAGTKLRHCPACARRRQTLNKL